MTSGHLTGNEDGASSVSQGEESLFTGRSGQGAVEAAAQEVAAGLVVGPVLGVGEVEGVGAWTVHADGSAVALTSDRDGVTGDATEGLKSYRIYHPEAPDMQGPSTE